MPTMLTMPTLQDRLTRLTYESKPRTDALFRDEKPAKPCP
jgi:hypothetical protein